MAQYDVNSFQSLVTAIQTANDSPEADQIVLTSSIVLTDHLPLLNDDGQDSLNISGANPNGANFSLDGNGRHRIFWVQDGTVEFDNLTLVNGLAQGEDGNSGGGGAGMGGGLFIYDGEVTVTNSTFRRNKAIGGNSNSSQIIFQLGLSQLENGKGGGIGGAISNSAADGADGLDSSSTGASATAGQDGGFGGDGGNGGESIQNSDKGGDGGRGGFGGGGGRGGDGVIRSSSPAGFGGDGGFGGGGGNGGIGVSNTTEDGRGGLGGYGGGGGQSLSIAGSGNQGGFGGGHGGGGFITHSGGGGAGMGGAIFIRSGSLTVRDSLFSNNQAQQGLARRDPDALTFFGPAGDDGQGLGGAIFAVHEIDSSVGAPTALPTVNVDNVVFIHNRAGQAGSNSLDNVEDNQHLFVPQSNLSGRELSLGARQTAIAWDKTTGQISIVNLDSDSQAIAQVAIERLIADENWTFKATGDLNGDGREDILLHHSISGENLAWYLNEDGSGIQLENLIGRLVDNSAWEISGINDYNSDGINDIVLHNKTADQILAWYLDNQGHIQSESLMGRKILDDQWDIQATADFDGNGESDILLRHIYTGQLVLWEMLGQDIVLESLVGRPLADADWHIEGARDVDGNGTIDLLMRHQGTGQGVLWSMADKETIGSELLLTGTPSSNHQILL